MEPGLPGALGQAGQGEGEDLGPGVSDSHLLSLLRPVPGTPADYAQRLTSPIAVPHYRSLHG